MCRITSCAIVDLLARHELQVGTSCQIKSLAGKLFFDAHETPSLRGILKLFTVAPHGEYGLADEVEALEAGFHDHPAELIRFKCVDRKPLGLILG